MSVTFWFNNDEILVKRYSCQCRDLRDAPAINCFECKGTGEVTFKVDKHAVNMCNSNAWHFMQTIGIGPQYAGSMDPQLMLAQIERAERKPHCRDEMIDLCLAAQAADKTIHWG